MQDVKLKNKGSLPDEAVKPVDTIGKVYSTCALSCPVCQRSPTTYMMLFAPPAAKILRIVSDVAASPATCNLCMCSCQVF